VLGYPTTPVPSGGSELIADPGRAAGSGADAIVSCPRIPPVLVALLILAFAMGADRPSQAGPAEEDEPQVAPAVAPPIRVGAAPT